VANSTLLPNDTATRSPFFTPLFCKPLASALEWRSSASYVRMVRWWCETTLLNQVSLCSSIHSPFEDVRIAIAKPPYNTRKVLWHRLLKERRLLSSVAVNAQGLSSNVPRLAPHETPW